MRRPIVKYGRRRFPRKQPPPVKIKPGIDAGLKKVFAAIGIPTRHPFKPDPFQLRAIEAIEKGDCLVCAPTGAGKTWIAEQAIARTFAQGGRSWYASPLKALSNSKYAEFSSRFGAQQVGILTGDRKENMDAPIVVGTTEILRNQLYDAMHRGETLASDLVILDEAHFLGDEDRGVVWEETMIYLPPRIPLLMLSATIGNAAEIAAWLSGLRFKACRVIDETKRPVPLYPLMLHPSGTLLPLLTSADASGRQKITPKVGRYLKSKTAPAMAPPHRLPPFGEILQVLKTYRLLPVIFFLKSRADCDRALTLCMENRISDPDRKKQLHRQVQSLVGQNTHIAAHRQRPFLERYAVGAHHSGQLPAWKLILESLMTDGLLDAVFATSTVAAGVNFPARTIVLLNSDRFNGTDFLPLSPTEFHQMTGRAGRRGMDRIGFALAVPGKFMDVRLIARLMTSPPSPVISRIKINFSMVLNLLLSHTVEQIEDLLHKSFAAFLMERHGRRRSEQFPVRNEQRRLQEDFWRHLKFLEKKGYVLSTGELTEDGRWASRLRIDQPLLLAEGFRLKALPDSDPALLAAIMAAFVNERESDDRFDRRMVPKKLLGSFLKAKRGLRPFARQMAAGGFWVAPLFFRPAVTMYAWASGHPWQKVLALAEIEEGDLAMLILRTADNLRHITAIGEAFPEAARSAAEAVALILREPVTVDYADLP